MEEVPMVEGCFLDKEGDWWFGLPTVGAVGKQQLGVLSWADSRSSCERQLLSKWQSTVRPCN